MKYVRWQKFGQVYYLVDLKSNDDLKICEVYAYFGDKFKVTFVKKNLPKEFPIIVPGAIYSSFERVNEVVKNTLTPFGYRLAAKRELNWI
jgi:hypothetical protein